jgi:hypothetical protein
VVTVLAFGLPYLLLRFYLLDDYRSVALRHRRTFDAVDLYMLCFGRYTFVVLCRGCG